MALVVSKINKKKHSCATICTFFLLIFLVFLSKFKDYNYFCKFYYYK